MCNSSQKSMAISDFTTLLNSIDIETCQSLQNEELEVLQSIFPECIRSLKSDGILKIEIPVEFGSPRVINVSDANLSASSCSSSGTRRGEGLSLNVLPPVVLLVSLPPSYPLYAPPDIISVNVTHKWLANTNDIKDALFKTFNSGETVLYNWIEYLRNGDFLVDLHSLSPDDGLSVELCHPNPSLLATSLCRFEASFNSAQFSQNSYPCSICLTHLKGMNCVKLQCEHIFCRGCLEDFWSMYITEGDVGRVGCPDPDCVKDGKESCEDEVATIVSTSDVERWRWLKMKRELERDPTIMHCARPQCQSLVARPGDADPESGWARFRQCGECFYSFCALCKNTWHGPVSPCAVGYKQRLLQEYLAAEEDSTERTTLELRYGRPFVLRLIAEHEQEQATTQWISSSTTLCPGCETPVQKTEGCNHMTCTRCSKHFCYRCGDVLDPKTPYSHFSIEGSQCFKKLFDFVPFDDEGWQ